MKDMPIKPMVRQYVSDFLMIGLFSIFFITIIVACFIAWNQVVWHSQDATNYAAEYTGILNNVIVYLLGVFSGVVGVLFNIKPEDQRKSIDQSVKVAKEIGALAFAEKEQSPEEANDNE